MRSFLLFFLTFLLPLILFINQAILLHRLQNRFGLHGTLDWFSSYLISHSGAVSIQNSTSFSNHSCGVPQGSALGPLLFTLHTTLLALSSPRTQPSITSMLMRASQLVVWLRFRPLDRRVGGSTPESSIFLTNSSGQATNTLVSLFTKQ